MTAHGRLCKFDVTPVSRQKQIRRMAQPQISGLTSKGSPRPITDVNSTLFRCLLADLKQPFNTGIL